jgi:imidazolonepropionase-like amidohydrolase
MRPNHFFPMLAACAAALGAIAATSADAATPMTDEEMSTLIEVAHRNGIKVTAHNGSSEAARQALRFGIDGFEHGYHLDTAVLRDMKAKGVWLVPTIVVTQPGALEFYGRSGRRRGFWNASRSPALTGPCCRTPSEWV